MTRLLLVSLLLLAGLPVLEAGPEVQRPGVTPLKTLHRFPPQPLGEAIHPAVAKGLSKEDVGLHACVNRSAWAHLVCTPEQ